jgi:hypothetical protein
MMNKINLPDWYLQTGLAQNKVTAMGKSEIKALLNGLGRLTENLDSNMEKMGEGYGEKLAQKKHRLYARYEFEEFDVATQTQIYREINFKDETSTFHQKMVRVKTDREDTPLRIFYYLETLQGDISSACWVEPDTGSTEETLKTLKTLCKESQINIARTEKIKNNYFVLLHYIPEIRNNGSDTNCVTNEN